MLNTETTDLPTFDKKNDRNLCEKMLNVFSIL